MGGAFKMWMTHQDTVEALTHMGLDASLLAQHLDVRMASADYFCTADRVHLAAILSADEALCNLVIFDFV